MDSTKMASHLKQVSIKRKDTYRPSPDDVMCDPEIIVSSLGYPIDKAEHLILSKKLPSGFFFFLAGGCSGVAVTYLFEIAGKIVDALVNDTSVEIESWKKWAIVISTFCCIACLLLGIFLPSEKKRLLKRIKGHLDSQPRTVESRRKYKTSCRRY